MEVKYLSGGERNRVLLAKLLARPANVMVLDEPTNDLDAETLEVLESQVVDFGGTVLVVSHDRSFLNAVATSTLVFEDGNVREYVGGYDDYERVRLAREAEKVTREEKAKPTAAPVATSSPPSSGKKLSFKEQRELQQLPELIESTEQEIAAMHEAMARPDFYQRDGASIAKEQARLQELEKKLEVAYARWEELESRVG